MSARRSVFTATAIGMVLGLSACAGMNPTIAQSPVTDQVNTAKATRHVLAFDSTPTSFAEIIAKLPKRLTLAEADRLLVSLSTPTPSFGLLARPAVRARNLARRGLAPHGRFGRLGPNIYGQGAIGVGAFSDAGMISPGIDASSSRSLGDARYLPVGNMRFPYTQAQGSDCLQPYVTDRQVTPFFVEKTTVAVPKVHHVAREIQVPRCATTTQDIQVPRCATTTQDIQVPRCVNVAQTINVPQTIGVKQMVNQTQIRMREETIMVPTTRLVPEEVNCPVEVTVPHEICTQETIQVPTTVMETQTIEVPTTVMETQTIEVPTTVMETQVISEPVVTTECVETQTVHAPPASQSTCGGATPYSYGM